MSTCWKCGKELPEGQTECEYGCAKDTDIIDAQIREVYRRQKARTAHIDWAKVQTMADVRAVLECLFGSRVLFPAGIPEAIKRFLKEGE